MNISATSVHFDDNQMWVELTDGRTLGVPLAWYPRLFRATPKQREQVEISRLGLHWVDIDEDISVAGLIAGRRDMTASGSPAEHPAARTSGSFDLYRDEKGQYRFRFVSPGGQVLLTSEPYSTKQAAMLAIETLRDTWQSEVRDQTAA